MEMQICSYEPPTMATMPIKIERDDDERDSCENSEPETPYVSTVPIAADKNTGSYYFPSQAIVAPRTPVFATVNKIAQKRKTIQALAQAALMTADEPMLFEETLWLNNAKIVLIDTKTKQAVAREHLRKDSSTTPQPSQTTASTTTASATRDTPSQAPRTEKSYSLRHKTGSTITTKPQVETSSSTSNDIRPYTAPTLPANTTCAASISTAVAITALATRPTESQPRTPDTLSATTSASRPRTSLLNTLPSERTEPPKNLADKPPPKQQTTYKPLAPSSAVLPETNSKMAVCLPNTYTVAKTSESSVARCVYVPREINLGASELRLEDCINVKDICDKELTKWTAEDVAKFVRATDCSDYAHVFVDQEIDGKALTLLNQDFLIQWMKLKLGPAMKLNCHIRNLKHSLNTS